MKTRPYFLDEYKTIVAFSKRAAERGQAVTIGMSQSCPTRALGSFPKRDSHIVDS